MVTAHVIRGNASLADFLQIIRLRKALIVLILALVVVTALAVTAFCRAGISPPPRSGSKNRRAK
ncbi:MAG: hypothetical protein EXS37_17870 [Opitutus sp.]|nr:hypothetical protein [Opitutus sp.]